MFKSACFLLALLSLTISITTAEEAWGFRGNLALGEYDVSPFAFQEPTTLEAATFARASKPILQDRMWVISYYVPSAPINDRYRVKLWEVGLNDVKIHTHDPVAPSLPPTIRSMTALGYTAAAYNGDLFANVMTAGGSTIQGILSNLSDNSYTQIGLPHDVYFSSDDESFPDLPEARAGGIIEQDVTIPLDIDEYGFANASVYVFAGETDHGMTNSMLKLYTPPGYSIPTRWDTISPAGIAVPSPRADLTGIAVGNKWYIFGGQNSTHVFGDTWVFDFSTRIWTLLHDSGTIPRGLATKRATTQVEDIRTAVPITNTNQGPNAQILKSPAARFGHSMALVSEDKTGTQIIVLTGGFDGSTYYNDLWALDPKSQNWEKIAVPGRTFAPRTYTALLSLPNTPVVYLYAGNDETTYYNDLWTINMHFLFDSINQVSAATCTASALQGTFYIAVAIFLIALM